MRFSPWVVLVATLVLTACSGSGSAASPTTTATVPTTTVAPTTAVVTTTEPPVTTTTLDAKQKETLSLYQLMVKTLCTGTPNDILATMAQASYQPSWASIGKTLPGFVADIKRCELASGNPNPTLPPSNPPTMSLDEFNRITAGMSHAQVTAIVGGPGTVQVQSDVGGISTVIYGWTGEGSDGANATVEFQNDREITKAQAGLQ